MGDGRPRHESLVTSDPYTKFMPGEDKFSGITDGLGEKSSFGKTTGVVGYAVRAKDPLKQGDVDTPAAVLTNERGKRYFADEQYLSERIENAAAGPEKNVYRTALEGLHEKLANGEDLGKPLGSVDQYRTSFERNVADPIAATQQKTLGAHGDISGVSKQQEFQP